MELLKRIHKRLFNYEIWIATMLVLMPLILITFDGGNIRSSVSNYVYMEHNQVYYLILFSAATLFSNNGALWVKNYNIVLGLLLAGVALTPHLEFPIIHQVLAAVFFAGSVFVMIFYSSKKQRKYKIYAGAFIIVGMLGHFVLGVYSLFYAEWIGIVPIAIHYLGESKGIVD